MPTILTRELAPHLRPERPTVHVVACERTGRALPYGIHVDRASAEAHLKLLDRLADAEAAEAERLDRLARRADRDRIAARKRRKKTEEVTSRVVAA